MPSDDLDQWIADADERGPLFEAARARIDAIEVDESRVDAIARRVERRVAGRRWWIPLVVAGLAAAVALAWVLTNAARAPDDQALVTSPDARDASPTAPGAPKTFPEPRVAVAATDAEAAAVDALRDQIHARLASGDVAGGITAALDFAQQYGPRSAWATDHGSPAHLASTAKLLRKAAVLAHGHARAQDDSEVLQQASVAYELYLSDFAEPEHETNVRYAYGEMLYEEERFDEAWEQYTAVARDQDHDKAKFCARSAVFAAEAMRKEDDDPDLWRERLVDSVDAYVEAWPDDDAVVKMKYKAAFAVYEMDSYASIDRFEALATEAPETTEGGYAANLALDGYVIARDFGGAAEFAASFLTLEDVPEPLRAEISRIGVNAAYTDAVLRIRAGADPDEVWAAYLMAWPDGRPPPTNPPQ